MLETTEIKKPKTVMIATPMYGNMCTGNFMVGILQTVLKLQSVGIQTYFAHLGNESLITRARNEMARIFLDSDADYLMFIDSDIGFNGDAVLSLIQADKDIVCGAYPKKEVDWARIEQAAAEGKTGLIDYAGAFVINHVSNTADVGIDDTNCMEVRHGGTGFMLIKRAVFDKLADKVPTYRSSTIKDANGQYTKPEVKEFFATSIDDTGCLLSEDYHFCALWSKEGGKIYVNPFIKLEHVGTYVYRGDIIKGGSNLK